MLVNVLGLDIGGANLKAAHTGGAARVRPFALWKAPAALPDALRALLRDWPPFDRLAVTITGELCDCFESKRQGVAAILDAVEAAAAPVPIRVWRTDGRSVDPAAARAAPLLTASANWHALATYAGRLAPTGPALLFDIGSTTADIIPLVHGKPMPEGRTDSERLRSGELVYAGIRRTPLCALLGSGASAEVFATTLDLFLLFGHVPEDPSDTQTADGRPATRAAAQARLARMLCADLETSTEDERTRLAQRALLRLVSWLTSAVNVVARRLPGPPQTVIVAGSGEFLVRLVLERQEAFRPCRAVSLAGLLGPALSEAACAYAVAVLASEEASGKP
jgi:probable H4MPT-linked C1 transfer pathway protein